MNVRLAFVVGILSSACGAPVQGTSGARPTQIQPAAPSYALHEWGLVRAEAGDVLRAGAVAPVSVRPLAVLKPVLYFHATEALTVDSVVVRASAGGSLSEVWPLAAFDTAVRWNDVRLDPSGACEPSALPTATDPPCSTLPPDDLCEAAGLAVARTTDAACVTVGSAVERFLFYRARVTRFTPPLRFERTTTSGEVRVTNEGTLPIPGLLVRIRAAPGQIETLAVSAPRPGTSVTVGARFEVIGLDTTTAARVGLRSSMLEIGLTEPEADAFLLAWADALFRPSEDAHLLPPTQGMTLDLSLQAPIESFVYFLPEPTTDSIAILALDPAPRVVHRAIAVWSVLRAAGPSY